MGSRELGRQGEGKGCRRGTHPPKLPSPTFRKYWNMPVAAAAAAAACPALAPSSGFFMPG